MAGGDNPIEAAFDEIDAKEGKSATSGTRRILSALAAIVTLAAFGIAGSVHGNNRARP